MNQRTPQDQIISHSLSLTARGEESQLSGSPHAVVHMITHESRLSTQHELRDELRDEQRNIAFEHITSSKLSDQILGVQALHQLASDGDSEAAHLLSEVALSSKEVVTHLNLNAERLVEWAAELGHPNARFYLAMRKLNGSEEQEDEGMAQLSELALEGFKEAASFVGSMRGPADLK